MISRRLLLTGAASVLMVSPSKAGFLFFKSEAEVADERSKGLAELKALRKKVRQSAKSKKAPKMTEDEVARLAELQKAEPKWLAADKTAKAKQSKADQMAAAKKKEMDAKLADAKVTNVKVSTKDKLIPGTTELKDPKAFSANEVAKLDAKITAQDAATRAGVTPVKKAKKKGWNIDPKFEPQDVAMTGYPAGTIVIDTKQRFLYLIESPLSARRYGVAVGKEGLDFHGTVAVGSKQEWPRWIPTLEMQERSPEKYAQYADGMDGGMGNPLGARAIYLYDGKQDTHLRIHGTTQPWTIGTAASNGCFRMVNEHVIDLYSRVTVGTKVIVL